MRFLGNVEAKTDAKGRAFLPAVFRKVLSASGEENLVLRKDVPAMSGVIPGKCMELAARYVEGTVEALEACASADVPSVRIRG